MLACRVDNDVLFQKEEQGLKIYGRAMKIAGIIVMIIGGFALLGTLISGSSLLGPVFWMAIGGYLIHCGNKKKKKNEKFEQWKEGGEENNA